MTEIQKAYDDMATVLTSVKDKYEAGDGDGAMKDLLGGMSAVGSYQSAVLRFMVEESDRVSAAMNSSSGYTKKQKIVNDQMVLQGIDKVTGDKHKFRQWNHKIKTALGAIEIKHDP